MQPRPEINDFRVTVELGAVTLNGSLIVPSDAHGLVLFAHGSGSSHLSPRNAFVAAAIRTAGIGTLLFDLLTEAEEARDAFTGELRFNVALLAERLHAATQWLREDDRLQGLPIGYFGASTGAAAALLAAAEHPENIAAIVGRGGRPDLAGDALTQVRAPTLLLVGELDPSVIPLNEQAFAQLQCEKQLIIVPGATHLFRERGTLEQVSRHAANWFQQHFAHAPASQRIDVQRENDEGRRYL